MCESLLGTVERSGVLAPTEEMSVALDGKNRFRDHGHGVRKGSYRCSQDR